MKLGSFKVSVFVPVMAIAAGLLSSSAADAAAEAVVPLTLGNTWVLQSSAYPTPIVLTVESADSVGGLVLANVQFQNPVYTYSLLLRSSGSNILMDGFAYGGIEYRFNAPAPLFTPGTAVGQTWVSQMGTVTLTGVNESVVTPAGTFSGCLEYSVVMPDGTTWDWTIAPGEGFVQFGSGTSAFVLQSVQLGTAPVAATPKAVACPPLGLSSIPWSQGLTSSQISGAFTPAYAAGARLLAVTVPWNQLEPSPGNYDLSTLAAELQLSAKYKIPSALTIGTIFSSTTTMPADLAGRAWSDPVVISRFEALLAALNSQIPAQTQWVNLGYEVDIYLSQNPTVVTPYMFFLQQVRQAAKSIMPGKSFGVVFSFDSVRISTATYSWFSGFGDYVAFDYYAIGPDFVERDPSVPAADLWLMRHLANGLPVLLNEVGYSSSSLLGGGPTAQQQFFQNFSAAVQQDAATLLGAVVWSMNDMPAASVASAASQLGAGTDANAVAFLGSLGLRDSDGTPKPAWSTFTTSAASMAAANACFAE